MVSIRSGFRTCTLYEGDRGPSREGRRWSGDKCKGDGMGFIERGNGRDEKTQTKKKDREQ